VRTTRPDANGATITPGGVGSCYAEIGMTETDGSASYESTFFTCETEPVTPPGTGDCTPTFISGYAESG
jgi:hypothetical protein